MGAYTTIYVRALVTKEEWVAVSALDLKDAFEKVESYPYVVRVLEASYEPGGVVV